MKTSICVTVFNEETSIARLLESLFVQSKKPDEIIIVDGGSTDKTVEITRHYQKKDKRIKLLVQKCTRAQGRNLGVKLASNKIIAMTDAGCVADKYWLERIVKPFNNREVEVVAGFYKMTATNNFQKAASVFLGVTPRNFDSSFLPSTRSIAFRKKVWEEVGGFPENLKDTAEDTMFNYKLIENGVKIARVKDTIVEWGMPSALQEFVNMVYRYSKGDAQSGKWVFPGKMLTSHNIKNIFKILRYSLGLIIFVLAFSHPLLWPILVLLIAVYSLWALKKIYLEFPDIRVGLWGIILQYSSDFAAIYGFTSGIINK